MRIRNNIILALSVIVLGIGLNIAYDRSKAKPAAYIDANGHCLAWVGQYSNVSDVCPEDWKNIEHVEIHMLVK